MSGGSHSLAVAPFTRFLFPPTINSEMQHAFPPPSSLPGATTSSTDTEGTAESVVRQSAGKGSSNRRRKGHPIYDVNKILELVVDTVTPQYRNAGKYICELGCVNHARAGARARVTQPSPRIFLHICIYVL